MDTKDIIIILSFGVMLSLIFKDMYLRRKQMELQESLMYAKEFKDNQKIKDLKRIMVFVGDKGKVTDDMIEGLLDVSDETARRYLIELEGMGNIIAHGKTSKDIHYTKNYNRKDLI